MALSSNGQDKWFSSTKSGFDSPWGYQKKDLMNEVFFLCMPRGNRTGMSERRLRTKSAGSQEASPKQSATVQDMPRANDCCPVDDRRAEFPVGLPEKNLIYEIFFYVRHERIEIHKKIDRQNSYAIITIQIKFQHEPKRSALMRVHQSQPLTFIKTRFQYFWGGFLRKR